MSRSADVVVVGAGIVGAAVAQSLAAAGMSVVVLERGGVCSGTSGCSMGHLMVVPDPPDMYRLSRRSVERWHELAAELDGFEFNHTGCLWLAEVEEDLPYMRELRDSFVALGNDCEILDAAQLREREPGIAGDLLGGFYYPLDAVVMPMLAVGALLRRAVVDGARVVPHTAVTGLRRGANGGVEAVLTEQGAWSCGSVVNAAGVHAPWITEFAGIGRIPVFPRRGDLAITMPRECPVRHQLIEVGYLRTASGKTIDPRSGEHDPGGGALNVQPQSNGTCLIGSSRQFAGYDRTVNRELMAVSLERAARLIPSLAGARVVRTWAGLRPYTLDKRPFIGPVEEVPGLYLAAGHEGLGITLSAVTGELITDCLLGRVPRVPLETFLPARIGDLARA